MWKKKFWVDSFRGERLVHSPTNESKMGMEDLENLKGNRRLWLEPYGNSMRNSIPRNVRTAVRVRESRPSQQTAEKTVPLVVGRVVHKLSELIRTRSNEELREGRDPNELREIAVRNGKAFGWSEPDVRFPFLVVHPGADALVNPGQRYLAMAHIGLTANNPWHAPLPRSALGFPSNIIANTAVKLAVNPLRDALACSTRRAMFTPGVVANSLTVHCPWNLDEGYVVRPIPPSSSLAPVFAPIDGSNPQQNLVADEDRLTIRLRRKSVLVRHCSGSQRRCMPCWGTSRGGNRQADAEEGGIDSSPNVGSKFSRGVSICYLVPKFGWAHAVTV
ncbi:hypothetical protein B0H19DRAFT_1062806 [Mycena capillaripes]|nr:hypothetical protein B0H19DRAFT_1062806 [Mycena capillaripes]